MPLAVLIDITASALAGGVIGWATNALAVGMLFRKYGAWGGVIEASYREFIRDMSALIENNLLNRRTLRERLKAEAPRQTVRLWISDILERALPEQSRAARIIDIPGALRSARGLINLAEKLEPAFFKRLLQEDKPVAAYLSEEQYRHVTSAVCGVISAHQDELKALLHASGEESARAPALGDALPARFTGRLQANLHNALEQTEDAWFDAASGTLLHGLFQAVDAAALKQMPLAGLLGEAAPLVRQTARKAAALLSDGETRALCREILQSILDEAKLSTITLASLLTGESRAALRSFCERRLPEVIETLVTLLMEHRAEIEALVNRALDEQLDTTIGGITGKLLKNLFTGNLARELDVCGRLAAALRGQKGAARAIINALFDKLETVSAGGLITRLSGVLSAERLVESLYTLLCRAGENPHDYAPYAEEALKHSLDDIIRAAGLQDDISALFSRAAEYVKRRFLHTGKMRAALLSYADAHPLSNVRNPLAVLLKDAQTARWDVRLMARTLGGLWDTLAPLPVKDLSAPVSYAAPHFHLARMLGGHFWRKCRMTELNSIYAFVQHEQIYTKAEEALNTIIDERLDTLLTGTVSALAAKELSKLRPKDINLMVQAFMGSQMKSINILGGVLGVMTGILTAAVSLIAGLSAPLPWWLYMMIFAALGIGTNALAIMMLFRPYTPLYRGASMPPFIGVAPAGKARFARLAGEVIQTTMFGGKPLTESFAGHKEAVRVYCLEKIRTAGYAALDVLTADAVRHNTLTGTVTEAVSTYLAEHKEQCAAAVQETIEQLTRRGTVQSRIPVFCRTISAALGSHVPALASLIKKGLFAFKTPLTGAACRYAARQILEALRAFLTPDALKAFAHRHGEAYSLYLRTHSPEQLGGERLATALSRSLPHLITAGLRGLSAPALDALEKAACGKETLRECAGGLIFGALRKNTGMLLKMFLARSMTDAARIRLIRAIERALPLYALPWKEHIRPVLDTLLDRDAPRFIESRHEDFSRLSDTLGEAALTELFGGRPFLNRGAVQAAFFAVVDAPQVCERITRVSACGAARLTALSLDKLLGPVYAQDAGALLIALERPLNALAARIEQRISGGAAAEFGLRLTAPAQQWLSAQGARLLSGLDIDEAARSCTALWAQDAGLMCRVEAALEIVLNGLAHHPVLINRRVLRRDIARLLGDKERVFSMLAPVFKEALSAVNGAVSNDTKDALLGSHLLPAALDAGERYLAPLIDAIEVQGVIETEINAMDGRGIERLFRGFAGRYFTKIIWYGWIGAFGGLIGYLVSQFIRR